MSVNKAILVGRLGRDPETRYTSGGQAVANFTLATDESLQRPLRRAAEAHRMAPHRAVGKLAEITQQYLKKGMLVYIEGRIQTRQWEDKRDGQKKQHHGNRRQRDAHADVTRGRRCGRSQRGARGQPRTSADADFDVTSGLTMPRHGPEISDEDIPF